MFKHYVTLRPMIFGKNNPVVIWPNMGEAGHAQLFTLNTKNLIPPQNSPLLLLISFKEKENERKVHG